MVPLNGVSRLDYFLQPITQERRNVCRRKSALCLHCFEGSMLLLGYTDYMCLLSAPLGLLPIGQFTAAQVAYLNEVCPGDSQVEVELACTDVLQCVMQ